MILSRAQDLSSSPFFKGLHNLPLNSTTTPVRVTTTLFSPLSLTTNRRHRRHRRSHYKHLCSTSSFSPSFPLLNQTQNRVNEFSTVAISNTFVEQVAGAEEDWDSRRGRGKESERFDFDDSKVDPSDHRRLMSPVMEIKELEELPEQWRRSKLAWLCKELPGHKSGPLVRILNAQKKWMTQEDATYLAVHCTRLRENEAAFKVYKWMMQQSKYQFDFALATKLADYVGKERNFAKCREIFEDIIKQGRVPSESTFHVLIIAYLSSSVEGCLEEACGIYNRMIQLGGYKPSLSLHNSLFRALIGKPGGSSKYYLKQAEFIFHNIVTSGLEIQKDIIGGLIWLHSYQDTVDKERFASLISEMHSLGFVENKEVLVSILRACSKDGDVDEAERTWRKLLHYDNGIPPEAFVYKMEVYAKANEPMKSVEIFRDMPRSVVGYHKIIEVLSRAQEIDPAESLMKEFVESNLKPLMPSFIDMMNMYYDLNLHDKLESVFCQCIEKGRPNRTIYNIFLDSLVKVGNLEKAEEIFNQMVGNESIGVNARSCNSILKGYISCEDYVKAENIYDLMRLKKYEIEPSIMDKLDYILSLSRKIVKKPVSLKLSQEQREMLVGFLLGGLRIESDEDRKNHVLCFEFNSKPSTRLSGFKTHVYDQFHEWLNPSCKSSDDGREDIPDRLFTISHKYFDFYADQFRPKGRSMIPNLIHRWISPRALAYWYMYGGHRASSEDILLKVKGNPEGVEKIVKTFRAQSLECKVKRKGRVFWIGFQGSNATWFWKLIEPYVLDELKALPEVDSETLEDQILETQRVSFEGESYQCSAEDGDSDESAL